MLGWSYVGIGLIDLHLPRSRFWAKVDVKWFTGYKRYQVCTCRPNEGLTGGADGGGHDLQGANCEVWEVCEVWPGPKRFPKFPKVPSLAQCSQCFHCFPAGAWPGEQHQLDPLCPSIINLPRCVTGETASSVAPFGLVRWRPLPGPAGLAGRSTGARPAPALVGA